MVQKVMGQISEKVRTINIEQVLNCKYCNFTQMFGKKPLNGKKDKKEKTEWFPVQSFRNHIRKEHSMCEICEVKFVEKI